MDPVTVTKVAITLAKDKRVQKVLLAVVAGILGFIIIFVGLCVSVASGGGNATGNLINDVFGTPTTGLTSSMQTEIDNIKQYLVQIDTEVTALNIKGLDGNLIKSYFYAIYFGKPVDVSVTDFVNCFVDNDKAITDNKIIQSNIESLVGRPLTDNELATEATTYSAITGKGGTGDNNIVAVAVSQIGNVNGQPYWSWYGFNSRIPWCGCFVSWCANQCGYIDAGIIPKYDNVDDGIAWFQSHNEWIYGSATPSPGDIIFFSWDGIAADADHTGIVENVSNGRVHTVEGNSTNSVARRSYALGSSVIVGYGVVNVTAVTSRNLSS